MVVSLFSQEALQVAAWKEYTRKGEGAGDGKSRRLDVKHGALRCVPQQAQHDWPLVCARGGALLGTVHALPHTEEDVSHGMGMPARGVCRTLVDLIML